MSIEDITDSRIGKLQFEMRNRRGSCSTTGIIKRVLSCSYENICGNDYVSVWVEIVPSCIISKVNCLLLSAGDSVDRNLTFVGTIETENNETYQVYIR